ncbi:hypothetical protein BROSI_A3554 [Candidatus Brocadia sinica JPN1]|uniref:Uncharacterized protein n=1 Tax=Candidatus Brocadia sinica JPN1 TaxID=1197129 RepID=A0ABQ0JZF0_9BACT|nr:hypothetical protein BROSI_A2648 [Candidatus Brocadia sinica JPN1]GAN35008.1 hypothetical protein BROSI_A3554 [Candidatus Brocadia sinica JPN1]
MGGKYLQNTITKFFKIKIRLTQISFERGDL